MYRESQSAAAAPFGVWSYLAFSARLEGKCAETEAVSEQKRPPVAVQGLLEDTGSPQFH